jgi:hypothetical protein
MCVTARMAGTSPAMTLYRPFTVSRRKELDRFRGEAEGRCRGFTVANRRKAAIGGGDRHGSKIGE